MNDKRQHRDRERARRAGKPPSAASSARVVTAAELPRWLPPLVYALVTIILFRETVFTGARLLGTDTQALGYFARNFYTEFVQTFHRFPLWNPLLYGGLPFIDGMHGDIFYPPSLALFFLNAAPMWSWKMLLHVFLAGCFTYIWLREIGISRGASFVGGLIYMMGADLVSLVFPGGDGKLFVSALAPLAFWLTERAVVRRRVRDFAAFSLGIALMVFTSHMQLVYFCIWGVSLYFIFRVWQLARADESGRGGVRALAALGGFAVAGVLGVAAAAVQFAPPLQYLREWSHRADKTEQAQTGYAYSTTWSLHPEEIMSLVVPDFVGDNVPSELRSASTYWGRNPFKLNHEYAGFIPLLLLPLLFLRRRNGQAIFFTVLAALALLYSLGANTPLFRIFYMIPGVSLFRAPSLIIFLYGLSIATLGAMAIERALEWVRDADLERSARRALWIGVAIMGVLALLASAGVLTDLWRGVFPFRGTPQEVAMKVMAIDANLPFLKTGFWIIFAIAAAVAGAWEAYARGALGARGFIIALAVIAFFDGYRVDRPFIRGAVLINEVDDPVRYTPDESITFLQSRQQAGEVFRAIDLSTLPVQLEGQGYSHNTLALHGIEQLAGHHGNELGRYRQLIGGDVPVNLLTSNLKLADITNTTYLLSPQPLQVAGLTEVFRGSRTAVYRKDSALPRAYVVSTVQVVPDSLAVSMLLSPQFDPRTTVLVSESLPSGVAPQAGAQGTVQWLERANTVQRVRVNATAPALLVVLDNYYKAWHAEVDGREAPLLRANHTFRAIPIPAGQHDVVMRYSAETVQASAVTSGIILLVLAGLAFGGPLLDRVRRHA